jgi:hypothetical protein
MGRKKTKQAPNGCCACRISISLSARHCEANASAMSVKTEGV